MPKTSFYNLLKNIAVNGDKSLAILIDPDKFDLNSVDLFLDTVPIDTTHIFVGGSEVAEGLTEQVVKLLKIKCNLPIFLFPGDHSQLTPKADALLFLSLLSGRNAEYLVGQQVKSIKNLKDSQLEIIPTGYILIDGGTDSSVARISNTAPIPQEDIENIVHTALAGQYMGAKLIYLEAGSGAKFPIQPIVISAVKNELKIPLLVGGGIRTVKQKNMAYEAGADMVIMGTAFEKLIKRI